MSIFTRMRLKSLFSNFVSLSFSVCGGTFSTDTGLILSPLYPNTYETSRMCEYLIEAPIGKSIFLDFQDFDMEDNSYPSCEFDYLQVSQSLSKYNFNESFMDVYLFR